jgi:hypothetical protein
VQITIPHEGQPFQFSLRKDKLRDVRRREGRYLLRTNLVGRDPTEMWALYTQLVQVEEAFKTLKGDLAIRPIHHQKEKTIEAHIFVAFVAYALQVTLRRRLQDLAPGLTPPLCPRKVRVAADDRCSSSDHGRPQGDHVTLHPARAGTPNVAKTVAVVTA